MKQGTKTITRQVKVLEDPKPRFVSIVSHGAIQEPFKVLKSVNQKGTSSMPIKQKPAPTTAKKSDAQTATVKSAVRKLVFDKEYFADEAAVTVYLEANKFADYTITETNKEFTAEGNGSSDDNFVAKSITEVAAEDGVTAFVGKLQVPANEGGEAEETGETTEKDGTEKPAQKTERVVKFDWYDAYYSKGQTVKDVLESGMSDGIPPGVSEIMQASAVALGNVLGTDDNGETRASSVKSIFSDAADYIVLLDSMFAEALKNAEAQKTENVKKFVERHKTEKAAIGKKTEAPAPKAPDPKLAAALSSVTTKSATDEGKGGLDAEALQSILTKSIGEAVSSAVKSEVAPLKDEITAIKTQVSGVSEKVEKTAKEVSDIGSRAPVKKGANNEDPGKEPSEAQKKDAERKKAGVNNFVSAIGGFA